MKRNIEKKRRTAEPAKTEVLIRPFALIDSAQSQLDQNHPDCSCKCPHIFGDSRVLTTFLDLDVAMADYIRSAKPGSNWTGMELDAYNIIISTLPPAKFFLDPDPSLDHIDPVILNCPRSILNSPPSGTNPVISGVAARYLGYLAVLTTRSGLRVDFATETLKLLGFEDHRTILSLLYVVPLAVCGKTDLAAPTDVCLIHATHPAFVLLVVLTNDGTPFGTVNSEAPVIAAAIAAFQSNNKQRKDLGLDPLDTMTIPCIKMTNTRPTFYLVPVTDILSEAVIRGQYPATQTRVLHCATAATRTMSFNAGMEDTEYRKVALKRFLAFKALAKSHWERILEEV